MNDLNNTLIDMTRNPFLPKREPAPVSKIDQPGPNAWDFCKDRPETFGPEEDFRVVDNRIFYAVSEAALNWAYAKLPADIDRHNINGFVVGPQWIRFIVHRARQDKLMSRADYTEAMEEAHNQALQGEV